MAVDQQAELVRQLCDEMHAIFVKKDADRHTVFVAIGVVINETYPDDDTKAAKLDAALYTINKFARLSEDDCDHITIQ